MSNVYVRSPAQRGAYLPAEKGTDQMQKNQSEEPYTFSPKDGDRELGYPEKRTSEQCSMTGFEGIERNTSTLFEECIRNYSTDTSAVF